MTGTVRLYEKYAFYLFILGVSLTALGPAAHYIGVGIAFLLIVYGRLRYRDKMWRMPGTVYDFRVLAVTSAALIWSMTANALSAPSFYMFGKSASVSLEFLITILLTLRLLGLDAARDRFMKIFILANIVLSLTVVARVLFGVDMPNGALSNGNVIGVYSLLLLPVFCAYAFYGDTRAAGKYFLPALGLAIVAVSFSSGAWIAAFVECVVLAVCVIMNRRPFFCAKKILAAIVCIAAVFAVLLSFNENVVVQSFKREFNQLCSVANIEKFTNHRSGIWRSTLYFIGENPIIGYGRDTFEDNYAAKANIFHDRGFINKNDKTIYYHPHNMYLNILYDAGIPAIILFGLSCLMLLKKLALLMKNGSQGQRELMWTILGLTTLFGQFIWGLSNDVFDQRRDIAIIFWTIYSMLIVYPKYNERSASNERAERR